MFSQRGSWVACSTLTVKNENITRSRKTFGDDMWVMLTRDLVKRARDILSKDALVLGPRLFFKIRSQAPDKVAGRFVDDGDNICFSEADDDIVRIKEGMLFWVFVVPLIGT
jgi:hypothetical protein